MSPPAGSAQLDAIEQDFPLHSVTREFQDVMAGAERDRIETDHRQRGINAIQVEGCVAIPRDRVVPDLGRNRRHAGSMHHGKHDGVRAAFFDPEFHSERGSFRCRPPQRLAAWDETGGEAIGITHAGAGREVGGGAARSCRVLHEPEAQGGHRHEHIDDGDHEPFSCHPPTLRTSTSSLGCIFSDISAIILPGAHVQV